MEIVLIVSVISLTIVVVIWGMVWDYKRQVEHERRIEAIKRGYRVDRND